MTTQIVPCGPEHLEAIRAILNDAILHTTALYDYKPRTAEMLAAWFEAKSRGNYPILGAVDGGGRLLGFGSYGPFRANPAYKYTIEHSVYVERGARGRGLGRRLLQETIAAATAQQYHVMVGVIDSANALSIGLHERLGFVHAGTVRQAGFKFGRWLDASFYQLILPTPERPCDG